MEVGGQGGLGRRGENKMTGKGKEKHTVFPAVSTTPLTAPPAVFASPPPTPCIFARMPLAFSRCSGGILQYKVNPTIPKNLNIHHCFLKGFPEYVYISQFHIFPLAFFFHENPKKNNTKWRRQRVHFQRGKGRAKGENALGIISHSFRLADDIALALARQDVKVDDAIFGDFHLKFF